MRYLKSSLCPAVFVFITVGCNSGVDVFSGGDGDVFSGGETAVCDAEFAPTVAAFERVEAAAADHVARRIQERAEGCNAMLDVLAVPSVPLSIPATIDETMLACDQMLAALDSATWSFTWQEVPPCAANGNEVAQCEAECDGAIACEDLCLAAGHFAAVCETPFIDASTPNRVLEAALEAHFGKVIGRTFKFVDAMNGVSDGIDDVDVHRTNAPVCTAHQNRITTAMAAIADHSSLNSEFLGIY